MKILHAFDFFSPHGGGTIDLLYKLAKAQAQNGYDVSLYTSDYKLDQAYLDSIPEIKISLFHCISPLFGFYLMPSVVKAARETLKNYDVVHLHCFRSFQNIVLCHYARKYHIPYIMDTHGSLPRTHGQKGFKWLLKWFFDIVIGYRMLKAAACAIAESQVGVTEYKEYGLPEDKIAVISPPLDTAEFAHLPPKGQFKEKHNLQGKHIIMFLGRLNWIKGIDFLVESFAELAKTRDDVVLAIVGNDDGYKAILDNLISKLVIKDKVLFIGFLGGDDKLSALEDATMLIQPSRYEQGIRVPFEAILCNTPVIVSKHMGPGEVISKADGGYLVEYGNVGQLKDIIQYILEHPAEALIKTKNGQAYVEANFSLNSGSEKYVSLYREILGETKK
jgi:glycosyltransferase involved in cell wall biosynthesis